MEILPRSEAEVPYNTLKSRVRRSWYVMCAKGCRRTLMYLPIGLIILILIIFFLLYR